MLSEIGKYIDEDGNSIYEDLILTTQDLRSMHTIYNSLYIDGIVDVIRNVVIESAFKGKNNNCTYWDYWINYFFKLEDFQFFTPLKTVKKLKCY